MKYFLIVLFTVFCCDAQPVSASETDGLDSVTIRFAFRQGKTDLDLNYMENVGEYLHLRNTIESLDDKRAKSLTFAGHASPEGSYDLNMRLTQQRAERVVSILRNTYPGIFDNKMLTKVYCPKNSWGGIVERLEASNIGGCQEAIRLINKYGAAVQSENQSAALRDSLLAINGGRTWDAIYTEIFPYLRTGIVTVVFEPKHPVLAAAVHDTLVIRHETPSMPIPASNISGMVPEARHSITSDTASVVRKPSFFSHPRLALKTNLLFDLATALNVEVEIPILKNKYSILLEHTFPWWLPKLGGKQYALEILRSSVEVRYWFGNRAKMPLLTGFFAGVYAAADKIDFERQDLGWQLRTFCDFGVSFGWSKKLAKNWRLELSTAIGYFHATLKEYRQGATRDMLIYQCDRDFTWFAPTKLKCSISWLLPNYPRTGKHSADKAARKKGGMR